LGLADGTEVFATDVADRLSSANGHVAMFAMAHYYPQGCRVYVLHVVLPNAVLQLEPLPLHQPPQKFMAQAEAALRSH